MAPIRTSWRCMISAIFRQSLRSNSEQLRPHVLRISTYVRPAPAAVRTASSKSGEISSVITLARRTAIGPLCPTSVVRACVGVPAAARFASARRLAGDASSPRLTAQIDELRSSRRVVTAENDLQGCPTFLAGRRRLPVVRETVDPVGEVVGEGRESGRLHPSRIELPPTPWPLRRLQAVQMLRPREVSGVQRLAAAEAILDAENDRAPVSVHFQQVV